MASQIYICAQCGCPDLVAEKTTIVVAAKDRKVSCPNCKWEGTLAETAGIVTTEKLYDTKAVLNLLIYVTTKHAAGPIAQALTFIGLLEKGDQDGIDVVMRAATEGLVREAFMAAAAHAATKGVIGEKKHRVRCPDCGGRHILGEELPEDLGGGVCKTCGGSGEVVGTEETIAVPVPTVAVGNGEALKKFAAKEDERRRASATMHNEDEESQEK